MTNKIMYPPYTYVFIPDDEISLSIEEIKVWRSKYTYEEYGRRLTIQVLT